MTDETPRPLIDLPPVRGESLPGRIVRYTRRHRARVAAAVAVIVGVFIFLGHFLGGIAGIWEMYKLATGASGQASHAPAPLMSVAVLPITPAGAQPDHERLAESMTLDVTSALERSMRFALVASPGLAAQSAGNRVDARKAGRELNVRYLLFGEVRSEKGAPITVVRLVDTAKGVQVWSDRLQGAGPEVTGQLSNRVRSALYDAEAKRVASLPRGKGGALELVLRADSQWEQAPGLKGLRAAREVYEEALRQDPNSASALIGLFRTTYGQLFEELGSDRERLVKEMDELSLKAVRADRNDPRAWLVRANALSFQWKWDAALEANAEALRLDPYRSSTLGYRANILLLTGRAEEALPLLERAVAYDMRGTPLLHHTRCTAFQHLGRHDEAIAACEKALSLEDNWFFRMRLMASYALKDDMDKARTLKEEVLRRRPNLSIASLKALRTSDNAVFLDQRERHLFAGLRKSGIVD